MIEVLKHSFGFCGEHWHPNIFTLLLSGVAFSTPLSYIYYKLKNYGKDKS
jgi:hypothetical protein